MASDLSVFQLSLLEGKSLDHITLRIDNQMHIESNGDICNSSGYKFDNIFESGGFKNMTEYITHHLSLKVKKVKPDATIPSRGSKYSAGLDLYSCDDYEINPFETVAVNTGISIEMSPLQWGEIKERSGLALNSNVSVGGGVIDSDYRGEIKVIIRNLGKDKFIVKKGNKIAQLIIQRYEYCPLIEVSDELSTTQRGSQGFGSTGI